MLLNGIVPVSPMVTSAMAAFQTVTVNGKVVDETGEPLPGVSILEKGTANGTVSDADGVYKISVSSSSAVLVFSFVGTKSQEVLVGTQSELNITLAGDASTLSEVVVVGYGTQEQKDITGAVASVKSADFNRGIINSPEQLLQGKVAGVNVTSTSGEPGATQTITIRGVGGVRTGSTPLFVVDGMPLDNASTGGATNPLNFLNPQDIESQIVLKDAAATSIYGSRGANGVILITTKRGKSGRSSLNYTASYGISKMARPLDVFSADEYRQQVAAIGGTLDDGGASTDWQKEISRTAATKNHNLSLSGGADKLNYFASLGLQDQDGVLKNSNMKRYTGRLNVSQKLLPDDRLTIDLNLSATQTVNQRPPIEGIIGQAITSNPTLQAYNPDGTPFQYASGSNPMSTLALNKDITTINRVIGNITPSLRIVKGLVYKLNFGLDNASSARDFESLSSLVPKQDGRLESTFGNNTNTVLENYLTYQRTSGNHNYTVLAGHSYQKFFVQTRMFSINKFPITDLDPRYNPGIGQDLTLVNNLPTGSAQRNELQSFFGRVNYAFKDRYLATVTVRADGSSKFGDNNKYGTFPSFSLGWRISEEPFMASVPVSNLKLRAGWGKTGNQEIPNKITQALYTSVLGSGTTYPMDGSTYPAGTTFSRLANPDIKWEWSTQTDVGLEFGFLNGALTGSIDYFNKVSNDILLKFIPADPVQPANTFWTNVKDMKVTNKGLEFALNYEYKAASGFSFSIGGNTTLIRNKVTNSPYSVIPSGSASGSGLTSATINGYVNNEPIGTFYLLDFIGFDETGISKYRDVDGDGIISDKDRIAAGSAAPKTLYNFNGTVAFKGFDLSFNFNGAAGNKLYDNTANTNFYKAKLYKGVNTTPEAIGSPEESPNNPARVSTRYLKDASFLRLNNLTLGYNFSPATLGLDGWVTALRLSVTGQNLFVKTKYNGYDPEVNIDRNIDGTSSYGIDYLSYPKARSFVFSLNVSF
ncbi:TonB-dependent receptor [Chryseolinea sp. Jin1]|uniref:TonB-dependent receptor n=2 Tax=Chryseolinea lacunae TaxID=2801331 RepID=A0ABS1KKP7_9BACT|nr:TonB-dependent receptor [Chryseolinea lacunae]